MPQKVSLLGARAVKSVSVVDYEGSHSQKAIAFISNRYRVATHGSKTRSAPSATTREFLKVRQTRLRRISGPFVMEIGERKWKK